MHISISSFRWKFNYGFVDGDRACMCYIFGGDYQQNLSLIEQFISKDLVSHVYYSVSSDINVIKSSAPILG